MELHSRRKTKTTMFHIFCSSDIFAKILMWNLSALTRRDTRFKHTCMQSLLCNGYDDFGDNSNSQFKLIIWLNHMKFHDRIRLAEFPKFSSVFYLSRVQYKAQCRCKKRWCHITPVLEHKTWKQFILRVDMSGKIWRGGTNNGLMKRKSLPSIRK